MPAAERKELKTVRCAIYTRKSSDEGLEQSFNSLQAQREACEAYIKSQIHEGWRGLPERYDDGGFSGGTMDRPALQALLSDIRTKKIDTVVVYKVDRLTRALSDFAKIVEIFDAQGVSFVSVTQQFNTTTSMGRLTLNVLLSFAQFEREVTGERIRDKIAASKQKGMWMGGVVPLGYEAKERALIVNEDEAQLVRDIFDLYLKFGTVQELKAELDRREMRTKRYITKTGRAIGNRPFSRGHLYKLLANSIYLGEVPHRGVRHPGLHKAIIEPEIWDAVQTRLKQSTRERQNGTTARHPSLLAGLIFHESGARFITTHATKNGKRYRYYVNETANDETVEPTAGEPLRIAASELEPLVISVITEALRDELRLFERVSGTSPAEMKSLLADAKQVASAIETALGSEKRALLIDIVLRIIVTKVGLQILLRPEMIWKNWVEGRPELGGQTFLIECSAQLVRPRQSVACVIEEKEGMDCLDRDRHVAELRALARGHVWFEELATSKSRSLEQIAKREGITGRYVSRLVANYLDRDIGSLIKIVDNFA